MKVTKGSLEGNPFTIQFAEDSFHKHTLTLKLRHSQPYSSDDACRTYQEFE